MDRSPRQPSSVAAWVATAAVVALFGAGSVVDPSPSRWVRGAGLLALLAALPLFTLPFAHLGRYGARERGRSYMDTTQVADRGVYALVRHPQYLGYSLLGAGLALISFHWVTVALAVLAAAGFHIQARGEERDLLQRMGAPYAAYMERVPRFNPVAGVWRWWRARRLTR